MSQAIKFPDLVGVLDVTESTAFVEKKLSVSPSEIVFVCLTVTRTLVFALIILSVAQAFLIGSTDGLFVSTGKTSSENCSRPEGM